MKKLSIGVLLVLCSLFCYGEKADALTDDDAGRLVYWPGKNVILIFQKCDTDANDMVRWRCTSFRGKGSFLVHPGDCSLLNYTAAELTPEVVAMELAYWAAKNNRRADGFLQIASKMNSPVTNKLLFFYTDLNNHLRSARREIAECAKAVREEKRNRSQLAAQNARNNASGASGQGCPYARNSAPNSTASSSSVASLLEDSLKDALKNPAAIKSIQDEAGTENNFFLAFCMYQKYRSGVVQLAREVSAEVRKEVFDELNQLGEEVREKYLQGRSHSQNRENDFRTLCRDRHGRWEFAPPTNLKTMSSFVDSCYRAWQKTLSLSPHSEFPEWGNAMLEVLQMVQSPALEQKFDAAFSEYQKYNSN